MQTLFYSSVDNKITLHYTAYAMFDVIYCLVWRAILIDTALCIVYLVVVWATALYKVVVMVMK